jgi:hypothetical protein
MLRLLKKARSRISNEKVAIATGIRSIDLGLRFAILGRLSTTSNISALRVMLLPTVRASGHSLDSGSRGRLGIRISGSCMTMLSCWPTFAARAPRSAAAPRNSRRDLLEKDLLAGVDF